MKILLIDDDELVLKTLTVRLRADGHDTLVAHNAYEAFSILSQTKPDLIISDVMMPYLSGLELLSIINHEFVRPIPFVMISGKNEDSLVKAAYNLGAKDYLAKPVNLGELRRCLQALMN